MESFALTAENARRGQAKWGAVELGRLVFPSVPDPYGGDFPPEFWLSRHAEYNRLQWERIDWEAVRRELSRAAAHLAEAGEELPEFEFSVPTLRERTYIEMWFGYGEPAPVEARSLGDGRFEVGYGQHRICAYADYPLGEADSALMKVGPRGFVPDPPLPPDTRIPMLVR